MKEGVCSRYPEHTRYGVVIAMMHGAAVVTRDVLGKLGPAKNVQPLS